jgi:hypothetical protein
VGILEVTNSNYSLNFAPGGSVTYDIATFNAPGTIFGTTGNNTLNGTSGDDIFNAGPGDHTVNGGVGTDTSIYWEPSNNFQISINAGNPAVTVQDKVGTDGTDTLSSIELVQFSDQTLQATWFTKAASLAAGQILKIVDLYTAGFNRAPDAVGLDYWASQLADGQSLSNISKSFLSSPEATAIYSPTSSAADFVSTAYFYVLGRAPDPAGASYWINQIQTDHVQRSDLITALISGAQSLNGSTADAQYVSNKEAVGAHFALTQGLTDVNWATAVESGVNASAVSVATANLHTDGFAATAATSNGSELVVQLVGIVP